MIFAQKQFGMETVPNNSTNGVKKQHPRFFSGDSHTENVFVIIMAKCCLNQDFYKIIKMARIKTDNRLKKS